VTREPPQGGNTVDVVKGRSPDSVAEKRGKEKRGVKKNKEKQQPQLEEREYVFLKGKILQKKKDIGQTPDCRAPW